MRIPTALISISDPRDRTRAIDLVRQNGFAEVICVANGFSIVELLAAAILGDEGAFRPDLIVVDAASAGCTGTSIQRGLRELEWETPVAVLAPPPAAGWLFPRRGEILDVEELARFIHFAEGTSPTMTIDQLSDREPAD